MRPTIDGSPFQRPPRRSKHRVCRISRLNPHGRVTPVTTQSPGVTCLDPCFREYCCLAAVKCSNRQQTCSDVRSCQKLHSQAAPKSCLLDRRYDLLPYNVPPGSNCGRISRFLLLVHAACANLDSLIVTWQSAATVDGQQGAGISRPSAVQGVHSVLSPCVLQPQILEPPISAQFQDRLNAKLHLPDMMPGLLTVLPPKYCCIIVVHTASCLNVLVTSSLP